MEDQDRSTNEVTIRGYRSEDRERVKDLTIEGFAGVAIEYLIEQRWPGTSPLDWGERKFREVDADLTAHPKTCFVAEAGGKVIGYITTMVVRGEGAGADSGPGGGRGVARPWHREAVARARSRLLPRARPGDRPDRDLIA